jgi:hypothetical protein
MRAERALLDEDERVLDPKRRFGPGGYGSDPNLVTPSTPWPSLLTPDQLALINSLSDIILPADHGIPSPSSLRIGAFFADWLSAPYDIQTADRQLITSGLSAVDQISNATYGHNFVRLSARQQYAIVAELSASWPIRPFFERFRYLLIAGYFTTDIGSAVLGYAGNVPLNDFPPLPIDLEQMIEEELERLGL